ncbi:MAG: type II toxin-antitoxin system Phd/YefM family antitoxin [Acidimicrobiales bacterium]
MYVPTLPVAEARAQLSRIVEEATNTHERFEITRSGRRVAVLLGADDYDALRETLTVLADTELLRDHAEGIAALEAGDSVDADGLDRIMRSAGRLPPAE